MLLWRPSRLSAPQLLLDLHISCLSFVELLSFLHHYSKYVRDYHGAERVWVSWRLESSERGMRVDLISSYVITTTVATFFVSLLLYTRRASR